MDDYPMSDNSAPEGPLSPSDPGTVGSGDAMFFQIWLLALTRPREDTYQTIVDDPRASIGRAALWIFITTMVSYGIAAVLQFGQMAVLFNQMEESSSLGAMAGGGVIALICGLPFVAGIAVLGAMVYAAILQFVAGALGGDGSFQELFYGTASFTAPMSLITTALSLIPFVGACLTIPLSFYTLYLYALVIKATNRFGWGSAIVSLLVPVIISILIGLIILAMLFPFVRDLMQSELGTF
ncbi:MAG: YIP1 family protein [Anaerolineales bacterium]